MFCGLTNAAKALGTRPWPESRMREQFNDAVDIPVTASTLSVDDKKPIFIADDEAPDTMVHQSDSYKDDLKRKKIMCFV